MFLPFRPVVRRPVLLRSSHVARATRAIASVIRVGLVGLTAIVVGCAPASHGVPAPTPVAANDSGLVRVLARERRDLGSAPRPPGTLAVMPFALTTGDTALAPLAYALADLLTTDLARSPRLTLVERARLGEVLRELSLTATGRVDSATGPRVGRLLQARQLVVGSLGAAGSERLDPRAGTGTLRLGVRVADVASGTIAQAVDASAPLTDVLAAEKALAFRIFESLGVILTPSERAAVEERPTTNLAALLAFGRGVREEYDGDFRRAVDDFARARRLDPKFRAAATRGTEARTLGETGTVTPLLVPGLRAVDGAVASTVDRLNRPLDPISSLTRPSTAVDPSFPVTTATVVIVVTRP